MAIKYDAYMRVGLLDALLPMYLDDIDYCKRMIDTSYRITYLPEAEVRHRWQQSTSQADGGSLAYVRGCLAIQTYLFKHHGVIEASAFRVAAMIVSPFRVILCGLLTRITSEPQRDFWLRQYRRSFGLMRWSWFCLSPWEGNHRDQSQAGGP
jgi:GT2 family glycosyltransferase